MIYGKTKQFREVLKDLKHAVRYSGKDEEGNAVFNNCELPTLNFVGTVKLHGTNASICYDSVNGLHTRSRNNVVNSGHFGFPEMVAQESKPIADMINSVDRYGPIFDKIEIFGEWAGPGVQKGVAISEIPQKTWFVFGIKITPFQGEPFWVEDLSKVNMLSSPRIRNITSFTTYHLQIDLENPASAINTIASLVDSIENKCPVAEEFGVDGVGEGLVFTTFYNGQRFHFKAKGEKHSASKVRKLSPVDAEKAMAHKEFIDTTVTYNRVKQAMFEVALAEGIPEEDLERSHTGKIMKWVQVDIITEEAELMKASSIEWKDVGKSASAKARNIFFTELGQI